MCDDRSPILATGYLLTSASRASGIMKHFIWAGISSFFVFMCATPPIWGQSFTFQKIVDRGATVPGTNRTYLTFEPPAFDGTNVAFISTTSSGTSFDCVSAWKGNTLQRIVDISSPVPGHADSVFLSFHKCDIDGGKVAFDSSYLHDGEVVPIEAVYLFDTSLHVLADTEDGLIHAISPTISQGVVAYSTSDRVSPARFGINLSGGGRIIDNTALVPGTNSVFGAFDRPQINGTNVAFFGAVNGNETPPNGIFIKGTNGLTTVVSSGSAIPEVADTFNTLNYIPAIDGTDVAFLGYGTTNSSYTGVFARIGGTLKKIADTNTAIPGGTGNFTKFALFQSWDDVAIAQGKVLFVGFGSNFQSGLYLHDGTQLVKVLAGGDTLDGRQIATITSGGAFRIGVRAFRGNKFAFIVTFASGGDSIYLATIGGGTGGCAAKRILDAAGPFNPLKTSPLQQLLPFSVSTANPSDDILTKLRRFRDRTLLPSPFGRELIAAYYAQGAVIAEVVVKDPALLKEAVLLLADISNAIASETQEPVQVRLPRETVLRGLRWMELVESRLPESAAPEVSRLRKQLEREQLVQGDTVTFRFAPATPD